jgi:hypothetical protein
MKNFKIEKSKQGYKVIPFTKQDCRDLFGSPGICDMCGNIADNGKYIFVLHNYECQACFKNFEKTIPFFTEDLKAEERNVLIFKQRHAGKAELIEQ